MCFNWKSFQPLNRADAERERERGERERGERGGGRERERARGERERGERERERGEERERERERERGEGWEREVCARWRERPLARAAVCFRCIIFILLQAGYTRSTFNSGHADGCRGNKHPFACPRLMHPWWIKALISLKMFMQFFPSEILKWQHAVKLQRKAPWKLEHRHMH